MKAKSTPFFALISMVIISSTGSSLLAQSPPPPTPSPAPQAPTSSTAANKGDGDPGAITPWSQSNAPEDLDVTRNIRKAVVNEKGFSVDAQNIKIITTANHAVYLKGVVDSEQERERVLALAKPIVGNRALNNQLTLPSETQKH